MPAPEDPLGDSQKNDEAGPAFWASRKFPGNANLPIGVLPVAPNANQEIGAPRRRQPVLPSIFI
jgi:hypothetical protein